MDQKQDVKITTRDRLLRAWQCSMELVRDFQDDSQEIHDDEAAIKAFAEFAEDEALHAARFLELLHRYEKA